MDFRLKNKLRSRGHLLSGLGFHAEGLYLAVHLGTAQQIYENLTPREPNFSV